MAKLISTSITGTLNVSGVSTLKAVTATSFTGDGSKVTNIAWANIASKTSVLTGSGLTGGGSLNADLTISHLDTNGYKHIPKDGAANQFLKYSASGTATWSALPVGTDGSYLLKTGGTMTGEIYNSLGSSWITGRDRAVINVGCGDASYASAIRSRGTNHTFTLGVLGNSQFGFYRYNNTETGNITNSSFYMDNAGNMKATGTITSPTFIGALQGNANTATQLATTRSINGTSFNGTGDITTANWGTSRTLTIGSTGKAVNGSGNVSWTIAEIGAAPTTHTHAYVPLTNNGSTTILADGDSSSTTEFIELKAGGNALRVTSSAGGASPTV
ncbi:MAG: hypothetical protein ACRC6B_04680, partial [Fusobacteriaceae bacterium]